MRYIEVTVNTPAEEIDLRCERMAAMGAGGFVIENEEDFRAFFEHNRQYWDYVDEELENKYHYSVSNIKEEFKDSFKVQSATLDGNFEKADFYIMSCETEVGNNPNSQRYAVYTVMLYEDGSSVVQIQAECSSKKEFKGWLNKIIRDSKASIKLQKNALRKIKGLIEKDKER